MDGDILAFAQVMTVIVLSTAAFVTIGLGTRILWRLGSRKRMPEATPVDADTVQRLETAVDAIALEVERISEAQRFSAALLSERLPARGERAGDLPSPGSAKRANTPH